MSRSGLQVDLGIPSAGDSEIPKRVSGRGRKGWQIAGKPVVSEIIVAVPLAGNSVGRYVLGGCRRENPQ